MTKNERRLRRKAMSRIRSGYSVEETVLFIGKREKLDHGAQAYLAVHVTRLCVKQRIMTREAAYSLVVQWPEQLRVGA